MSAGVIALIVMILVLGVVLIRQERTINKLRQDKIIALETYILANKDTIIGLDMISHLLTTYLADDHQQIMVNTDSTLLSGLDTLTKNRQQTRKLLESI